MVVFIVFSSNLFSASIALYPKLYINIATNNLRSIKFPNIKTIVKYIAGQ